MSSVAFLCVLASCVFNAQTATLGGKASDAQVVVAADAKQHLMRHETPHSATRPEHDLEDDADDNATGPAETVNIHLYYETRCPDCIMFINQTLAPMWNNLELRPHLNITMNPYGNAMSLPLKNVSEGYKFWHPDTTADDKGWEFVHVCQHGADECLGNVIQACAIHTPTVSQSQYMDLVVCMAAKPYWSVEKSSYECMTKFGIDHDEIKKCANSPMGNKLMAELGRKTMAVPGRTGTPWVMINGENLENTTDLMTAVCTPLGEGGPSACLPFTKGKAASKGEPDYGADGQFTVLPEVSAPEKDFVKLSADHI
jgi:hypothetical protein